MHGSFEGLFQAVIKLQFVAITFLISYIVPPSFSNPKPRTNGIILSPLAYVFSSFQFYMQRILWKPTRTWREHVNICTASNPSSGWNQRPWSCQVATLPAAPLTV